MLSEVRYAFLVLAFKRVCRLIALTFLAGCALGLPQERRRTGRSRPARAVLTEPTAAVIDTVMAGSGGGGRGRHGCASVAPAGARAGAAGTGGTGAGRLTAAHSICSQHHDRRRELWPLRPRLSAAVAASSASARPQPWPPGAGTLTVITLDSNYVYFGGSNVAIGRVPKAGGTVVSLTSEFSAYNWAVAGNRLYWVPRPEKRDMQSCALPDCAGGATVAGVAAFNYFALVATRQEPTSSGRPSILPRTRTSSKA